MTTDTPISPWRDVPQPSQVPSLYAGSTARGELAGAATGSRLGVASACLAGGTSMVSTGVGAVITFEEPAVFDADSEEFAAVSAVMARFTATAVAPRTAADSVARG